MDKNFKGRKKLDHDQIWIYRPYNHLICSVQKRAGRNTRGEWYKNILKSGKIAIFDILQSLKYDKMVKNGLFLGLTLESQKQENQLNSKMVLESINTIII